MPENKPKPSASTLKSILGKAKYLTPAFGLPMLARDVASRFSLNRMAQNLDPYSYASGGRSTAERFADAVFSNKKEVIIEPKATTLLPLNVKFQPIKLVNSLKSLATDFVFKPESVILKVKCEIKVKLWLFTINVPYEYVTTIKDLMTDNQANKSTTHKDVC